MDFDEKITQIVPLIQREKRVSYARLKRLFDLDESYIEDIKEELIYARKLAVDEDGKVLVWTDASPKVSLNSPPPLSYTPQHLTERILASRSALEGERKQVTVLFADIKDSTRLIENLDPEDAQELLEPVLKLMINAVHQYEGTVNNVMGDGIMAIFGAPLAHEDHAIRACYAALEMQDAFRKYAEKTLSDHGLEIRIREGINSGEVVVGAIHNDLYMDYSAVGPTTHLASRMEQLAAPDAIWITAATEQLVRGLVRVEPQGPTSVKGISEPVDVFEVVGVTALRGRLQVAALQGLAPYVGRQMEMNTLLRAQNLAKEGHGQVVTLVGEAGVGKSRLIHEFIHSNRTDGWSIFESASASYGKSTPYHPVIDLLTRYFGCEDGDKPETIRDRVTSSLLSSDKSLEDTIPALLALMDVLPKVIPFLRLPPDQQRESIFNALRRIILHECKEKPLALVFEDLHWLDSETQAFMDRLVEIIPIAPILVILSYRPEYEHGWDSKRYYNQVRINPLLSPSAEEFLNNLMGHGPDLKPLKDLLIERAHGNPFFMEESVRTLIEAEALDGERGDYRLAKTLTTIQMPTRVHSILEARIDRLPADAKRILQYAAVIGDNVPFALLKSIADMPEDSLRRSLAHLEDTEFLYQTRLFPDIEYNFIHALTHEVAYSGLLRSNRMAYHAAAGTALEDIFAGRIDETLELLAYHFGRSAEDDKAVDYALLAAEKMQRRWANSEALVHFDAARTRLESMPDSDENRLRRIDAVLRQGEVKFALGQHAGHIDSLEQIRDVVQDSEDLRRRATWHYWMGFLHSFTGTQSETAIAYCREASAISLQGGFDEIQAKADSCLAQAYFFEGNLHDALEAGESALSTFEALRDIWWACRTMWHLSTITNAMGSWEHSLGYCHRALKYGEEVDDLRLKVAGRLRMGAVHIQKGDPETGLYWCNEAMALSPGPFDTAFIKAAMGHALIKKGEFEEGTPGLKEAVDWFEQANLPYTRAIFAQYLGEVYLREGKLSQASEIFIDILAVSREGGYKHLEGNATRLLGESLVVDDLVAASEHMDSAMAILQEIGALNDVGKTLLAQGQLHICKEDYGTARELLTKAMEIFKNLGTEDEPLKVQKALAEFQEKMSA